ncbi:hypothetical protein [Amycolatopsis sp. lyj-346]|uniref:hypothetical protein n=1 Tax=Amycolatopsis sp. lyj-346 TaxID=2789289 RepID=UPI00397C0E4C
MRIHTKRTMQVALVSGGLLLVGTGSASAAVAVDPGVADSPLDQLVTQPALHGVTDDLQAAQPLEQASTGLDLRHPAQALDAVLHTVPVHLFEQELAPSAEVVGDLPEHDLNAPLGSELAATDLPALPVAVPLTATPNTAPERATLMPVDGELPVLSALPVHGDVSGRPLDPEEGTRVTGLHTSAGLAEAAAPGRPPAEPTHDQRADTSAAGLPLLGGLLPNINGLLPTQAPALAGVPELASLNSLTHLAGSTPLTHGSRYNTGAVTAP